MSEATHNQGFAPPAGRRRTSDCRLDHAGTVRCGHCGEVVPDGAHVFVAPWGPDGHVMYCPDHCPCRKNPGGGQ